MRHSIIILVLGAALLMCGNAFGQGPGALTTIASNGNLNMVRYDAATGVFIAASPHSGGVIHFIKTDLINFTEVKIEVTATIMDFEIIDRFIFFCGEDNFSGKGMLGCFNIDSLFSLGGGAHIDMDLYSTVGLTSLRNIEVFKKGTVYHIAGYGRDASLDPVAFEAVGHPYTGMKYRTLLLEYDNYKNEILDMAVTDNYVVYLRQEHYAFCDPNFIYGVTLIPFKKFNMFGPPIDSAYFFQTSIISEYAGYLYPENIEPRSSQASKIVHVTGDEVAVCAHRRRVDFLYCMTTHYGTPPWPQSDVCNCSRNLTKSYITLRNYDLSPLASGNPVLMTSAIAARLFDGETFSIPGFVYDYAAHCYAVLHYHETSWGIYEYGVTTLDFSSGVPSYASSEYQTAHSTASEWRPYSICLDNSSNYLIGGTDIYTQTPYYLWQNTILGGTLTGCNAIIANRVSDLPLVPEKGLVNLKKTSMWFSLSLAYKESLWIQHAACDLICN